MVSNFFDTLDAGQYKAASCVAALECYQQTKDIPVGGPGSNSGHNPVSANSLAGVLGSPECIPLAIPGSFPVGYPQNGGAVAESGGLARRSTVTHHLLALEEDWQNADDACPNQHRYYWLDCHSQRSYWSNRNYSKHCPKQRARTD